MHMKKEFYLFYNNGAFVVACDRQNKKIPIIKGKRAFLNGSFPIKIKNLHGNTIPII